MSLHLHRVVVPVHGGHQPATLLLPPDAARPAVVVLGPHLDGVVVARSLVGAGLAVLDVSHGRDAGRGWWEALAAFVRRQADLDGARLVLAAGGRSVHAVRDLVPVVDPVGLVLAPSWVPRPLGATIRRLHTLAALDLGGVGPDELTCPIVVPRHRPIPRWLQGTDLHRCLPEDIATTLAALVDPPSAAA